MHVENEKNKTKNNKKNRDSNYWLRDHVSHNKFWFDINWTKNSTLNILKCLVLQNRIN